jgi:glycosyltransferase involved in cell wall biosynthesis
MKTGVVGFCGGNKSGWGIRVRSLMCMLSTFSDVRLVYTEPEASIDDSLVAAMQGRIETERVEAPERRLARMTRLFNYYRSDERTVTDEAAGRAREGLDAIQVEALDLLFVGNRLSQGRLPIVLDEHDIRWELNQYAIYDSPLFRAKALQRPALQSILGPWLRSRANSFERSAMKKAAFVLFTSERDRAKALERVPQITERSTIIPNCIDVKRFSLTAPNRDKPLPEVLFIGRLDYPPNRDAVEKICQKLAPPLMGKAEFIVAGGQIPEMENVPKNVKFLGFVNDIRPHIVDSAICIVPLRFGSGTRMKILGYMASGRPIISTSKGCEGLDVKNEEDVIIADTDDSFVSAIRRLLDDEALAKRLGENAHRLAKEKYDWRVHSEKLRTAYESIGLRP